MRFATTAAAVVLVLGVAGCSSETEPAATRTPTATSAVDSDGLVCGLVDETLVRRVVGDAPIAVKGDTGEGSDPHQCRILDGESNVAVMQVSIGHADSKSLSSLAKELKDNKYGKCRVSLGKGLGSEARCTYPRGIWGQGASVKQIRDDVVTFAVVHNWPDATPKQRLALAAQVTDSVKEHFDD